MTEYWLVEDKNGKFRVYDRDNREVAPHRVVHLVEVCTVEPELAEVVRAAHSWEKEPQPGLPDELTDAELRMFESLRRLKPHQLRACGIEDDDD